MLVIIVLIHIPLFYAWDMCWKKVSCLHKRLCFNLVKHPWFDGSWIDSFVRHEACIRGGASFCRSFIWINCVPHNTSKFLFKHNLCLTKLSIQIDNGIYVHGSYSCISELVECWVEPLWTLFLLKYPMKFRYCAFICHSLAFASCRTITSNLLLDVNNIYDLL